MATTSASAPVLDPNDPHDQWLLGLDTSHIKPLEDDWQKHPYWADLGELDNDESSLAAVAKEMAIEDSPEEKAEDCKVPSSHCSDHTRVSVPSQPSQPSQHSTLPHAANRPQTCWRPTTNSIRNAAPLSCRIKATTL